MIDDLMPYPAYKNSGIAWLGKVPEHWQVEPVRRRLLPYVGVKIGPFGSQLKLDHLSDSGYKVYGQANVISRDFGRGTKYVNQGKFDELSACDVRPGDLLVTMMGTSGRCASVPDKAVHGIMDSHLLRLRMNGSANVSFTALVMDQSAYVNDQVAVAGKGSIMQGLNSGLVKNIVIAFPPLAEQSAILRFLNHMDHRIRRYVATKRKLIALLNEQKQAIINDAVTRGLDPNVPLKPSGVEWLGDVPEQWELRRNGQLFGQRNQTGLGNLPILEVSLRTGVRVRDFENSTRKQVMSDRDKYKLAVKGDIAYNMMRMWQGAVGVSPADGLVSPAYVVAKPLDGTEPRYYAHLFRTQAYMAEVDKFSRGIVKDRNRLYWEDFKQMPSPYPPYAEQVTIADAINQQTENVDLAIEKIEREIALVRQYRTSLIADVVTGKLDVREAAASLPEQPEAAEVPSDWDTLADDNQEDDALEGAMEEVEA